MVERRLRAPVQVNLRLSEADAAALDAWVDQVNADRWPELTRSDLLRLLVRWGVTTRPLVTGRGELHPPR